MLNSMKAYVFEYDLTRTKRFLVVIWAIGLISEA